MMQIATIIVIVVASEHCNDAPIGDERHVEHPILTDIVLRANRATRPRRGPIVPQIQCLRRGGSNQTGIAIASAHCPQLVVCSRHHTPAVAWNCTWTTNWVWQLLGPPESVRLHYEVGRTNRSVNAQSFALEIWRSPTLNERLVSFVHEACREWHVWDVVGVSTRTQQHHVVVLGTLLVWCAVILVLSRMYMLSEVRCKRGLMEAVLVALLCTLSTPIDRVVLNHPHYV